MIAGNQNHDFNQSFFVDPPKYAIEDSDIDSLGTRSRSSSNAYSDTTVFSRSSSLSSNSTMVDVDIKESNIPPPYSPSLYRKDNVWIKYELADPFTKSTIRSWRQGCIEISNTQLKVSYTAMGGIVSHSPVYSLQFAEVGLASDYTKKQHALRIRVEGKQILIVSNSCEAMQLNLVALLMGTSLALPLELRQLPEEIKRTRNIQRDRERRRRRRKASQRAVELGRLQEEERQSNLSSTYSDSDSNSYDSRQLGESTTVNTPENIKWDPSRHQSRFSEKDFPHLIFNSPWEGKSFLHGGKWAIVQNRRILLMPSRIEAPHTY